MIPVEGRPCEEQGRPLPFSRGHGGPGTYDLPPLEFERLSRSQMEELERKPIPVPMPEKMPHKCAVGRVTRGRITGWIAKCEQCGPAFRIRFKRAWADREAREHEEMWRIHGNDETN